MESGKKSRKMFQRAKNCLAYGVTSNYRYWGDNKSLVLKEGKGAYIWDQDDNKYLDYRLGFGPVILGHGYPTVIEKVAEALNMGNVFAMTHEYEIEAAEKIKSFTGLDLVRYANSGTEATMHAIRIARAFTGRNKIIKFEGTYHGMHDCVMWSNWPPFEAVGL
jgi:glutamate-1-semialdehyde 2,1-aminomutase